MLDVIVIGGGPAGSTAGAALARLGYDVLLLEKEAFPRHRIGESMLPASLDILDAVGVLDEVQTAGFPVKRGGVYAWGKTAEPWMFRFGERGLGSAFQVERGKFDSILLDNARRAGVDVRTEHRVVDILENDGRASGVVHENKHGQRTEVRSRWVLDASGQARVLGSRRSPRIVNEALRNVAVYGYWRGPRSLELTDVCAAAGADDRNSIFIEACRSGWCWWIPLAEDYFSVGAVVGHDAYPRATRGGLEAFYLGRIDETSFVSRLVGCAAVQGPIRLVRDWSYRSGRFCGPGFAMLGDAAAFVDPILSTGVFLALNAGVAIAKVINSTAQGLLGEETCLSWYENVYNAVYDDYAAMAQHWYFGERTQNSWFWRARRALPNDTPASFRETFIALSSGYPYSVHRQSVHVEMGPLTYLSGVSSLGGMGSPSALRTVSARLAGDLGRSSPESPGPDPDMRLALMATKDWTLSFALVRPDGSGTLLSAPDGERLMAAMRGAVDNQ
jgi:halogenation protein CepH